MKRLFPNTIFARLFGLVLAAIVASHLLTGLLVFAFTEPHPQPPPRAMPPAQEFRPAPPRRPPPFPGFWLGQITQCAAIALAAWFGARTIARPIQELARAASSLGDNLNSPPLCEQGPTEAREAARVFNRMQERIRSQMEERARFLAAVSHDLRTPLTRMRLRVAALGDTFSRDKLSDDIAEMAAMLDATLSYLRGEVQTERWQMLDIQALVESMVEDARESGRDVLLEGSAAPLLAQPMALQRCLSNLLENALQYGSSARLLLEDSSSNVVIEVRDEGPGIPENKMTQVFEPFVRLEPSRNKNSGGVGLGLAIAREAARRHGGELTLRNAPEGGLIARLVVPRRAG